MSSLDSSGKSDTEPSTGVGGHMERSDGKGASTDIEEVRGNARGRFSGMGAPLLLIFASTLGGGADGDGKSKDCVPKSPIAASTGEAVDHFLHSSQVTVTPEQRGTLIGLVEKVLSAPDPETREIQCQLLFKDIIYHLEEWGCEDIDIHDASLVFENASERLAAKINSLVTNNKMPTRNYASNVGIYQFSTEMTASGGIRYTRGARGTFEAFMENVLRSFGDKGKLRTKVKFPEIWENVRALGLRDHFFAVTENGEVVAMEEHTHDIHEGLFLDDLLRLQHEHPFLQQFDKVEALKMATGMVEKVHTQCSQGIAELLGNDIVLQRGKDGALAGARLTLPDMQYDEQLPLVEQQALDMLDLCFSVGTAGFQKSDEADAEAGEERARKYIGTVLDSYSVTGVKTQMQRFLDRGIPANTWHNRIRFGFDRVKKKKKTFKKIRDIIGEFVIE